MKLIVGLGNPGRKYAATRHNVGFEVVARLGRQFGDGTVRQRFQGEVSEARIDGSRLLLLCPLTFMNASGRSVRAASDFYRIDYHDILVICDDFNLPLARLRLRARGSAGGQKGLADILRAFGTDEIPRLRIGIGPVPAGRDVSAFVLSRFSEEERAGVNPSLQQAADAAADWVRHGVDYCMNHYNAG